MNIESRDPERYMPERFFSVHDDYLPPEFDYNVFYSDYAKDVFGPDQEDCGPFYKDYGLTQEMCRVNISSNNLENKKLVYVFGASSVVLSDGKIFSSLLEDRFLNSPEDVKVINYGVPGIDSKNIIYRANSSLDLEVPDVVILYLGHNDYIRVYTQSLDYFSLFFDPILDRLSLPHHIDHMFFLKLTFVKGVADIMINIGLLDFKTSGFSILNDFALERYQENVEKFIEIFAQQDVDIVYMTTIANLERRPIGNSTTKEIYRKGMASHNSSKRFSYLRKAVDSEIYSFALRAPSELNDYILDMNHSNVHILDLEKKLLAQEFTFGENDFRTTIHFSENTHELVSSVLYDFMIDNSLLLTSDSTQG